MPAGRCEMNSDGEKVFESIVTSVTYYLANWRAYPMYYSASETMVYTVLCSMDTPTPSRAYGS